MQADCIPKWGWLKEETGTSFTFVEPIHYLCATNSVPEFGQHGRHETSYAQNNCYHRLSSLAESRPRKTSPRIIYATTLPLLLADRRPNLHLHHRRLGFSRTALERLHPVTHEPKPSQPPQRPSDRRICLPHRHPPGISTIPRAHPIDCPAVRQPRKKRSLRRAVQFCQALFGGGRGTWGKSAWYQARLAH